MKAKVLKKNLGWSSQKGQLFSVNSKKHLIMHQWNLLHWTNMLPMQYKRTRYNTWCNAKNCNLNTVTFILL